MAKIYEVPMAKVVSFETNSIIATSVVDPDNDSPDSLSTWGKSIGEFASTEVNLFG